MLPLGLSAADQKLFNQSLCMSHSIRVHVSILDLNHNSISDLSHTLIGGQVNVDITAAISRNATLTVLDPDRTMQFDADNPNDGAVFMDRMVRITYGINSALLNRWVDVPIFCGPVTEISRDDDVVTIEAQGKEILSQRAAWRSASHRAGSYVIDVIKNLLQHTGETRFTLPPKKNKLTKALSINRETNVWSLVKSLSHGYNVFYDARGYFSMHIPVFTSRWNFNTGVGGSLKSYPEVTFSTENVKNTVLVKGGIPTGSKVAVEGVAYAPTNHPFSAQTLGRNGIPRYLVEVIEDSSIKTKTAAIALAKTRLTALLYESFDANFDSIVVPHLEPYDMITVTTPEFALTFGLRKFSIPLVHNEAMSVNKTKPLKVNKGTIRRKR